MKRSTAADPELPSSPPSELRAHAFELEGEGYVVLSYPVEPRPKLQGLTAAETAVVRAALDGLTNIEIAAARGRSVSTIQNQLATAWRKLGVGSRSEAAALLAALVGDA